MNIRNATTKLITITMAMAAMAVIGSGWTPGGAFASGPTAAEIFPQRSVVATIPPFGIVPGQMLRFSVGNLSTPEEGGGPVGAQVALYDAQGNVLARSQEVEVPPGQFRTIDFNRDDLPLAGEPGTGRLQGRAAIGLIVGGALGTGARCHASMEVIDNRTGQSIYSYDVTGRITSVAIDQ